MGEEKPSALKREHPALLFLWFIFALLDPDSDPLSSLNPDPIRIRIRNTDYLETRRFSNCLFCTTVYR
jgi:hypothetical protein